MLIIQKSFHILSQCVISLQWLSVGWKAGTSSTLGVGIFSRSRYPDCLWDPHIPLSVRHHGLVPRNKAAGVWYRALTHLHRFLCLMFCWICLPLLASFFSVRTRKEFQCLQIAVWPSNLVTANYWRSKGLSYHARTNITWKWFLSLYLCFSFEVHCVV